MDIFVSSYRCLTSRTTNEQLRWLTVRIADTWHQAAYIHPSSSSIEHGIPHIRKLNTDCLHEIFRLLSIMDLINLCFTSEQLCSAARDCIKMRYTSFDFADAGTPNMTLAEAKRIMRAVGPCVERLRVTSDSFRLSQATQPFRILKQITHYFNKLKELDIRGFQGNVSEEYAPILLSLEVLTLHECTLNILSKPTPKLRHLRLSKCNMPVDCNYYLQNLTGLESLNLAEYEQMSTDVLGVIIDNNSQLGYLDVTGIAIGMDTFQRIARLPALNHLACDDRYDAEMLMQCQHIKRIDLTVYDVGRTDLLLQTLAVHDSLDHLEVKCSAVMFNYDFLENMRSLKTLVVCGNYYRSPIERIFLTQLNRRANLKELHVLNCSVATGHPKILDILRNNPQLQRLYVSGRPDMHKFLPPLLDVLRLEPLHVIIHSHSWKMFQRSNINQVSQFKD